MKQKIRLTESQLQQVIKESVMNVLNETSSDTLWSAMDKATDKCYNTAFKYGEKDPRTKRARQQAQRFSDEYNKRYNEGGNATKAKMLQNSDDQFDGIRVYGDKPWGGRGWYTKKG